MTALALPQTPSLALLALADDAEDFAKAAYAPTTRKAYDTAWRTFTAWCAHEKVAPLPASEAVVALYLAHLAKLGRRIPTIDKHLAAISFAHKQAGLPLDFRTPRLRTLRVGVGRTLGHAQTRKDPCEVELLASVVGTLDPKRLGDVRDRALLLVGFFAARRCSEVVSLNVTDCRFVKAGLEVTVRKSKTDQAGDGYRVGIPFADNPDLCAVRALRLWIEMARLTDGPVFRAISRTQNVLARRLHSHHVARTLKRCVSAADLGLDAGGYAGHSLRAGFATAASRQGASLDSIMRQTGHKSVAVAMRYVRHGSLFTQNAARKLA